MYDINLYILVQEEQHTRALVTALFAPISHKLVLTCTHVIYVYIHIGIFSAYKYERFPGLTKITQYSNQLRSPLVVHYIMYKLATINSPFFNPLSRDHTYISSLSLESFLEVHHQSRSF